MTASKGKASLVFLSVSVWFSSESKSKLSEAIATENFALQSEMC